ncbi:MAG: lysylphosphatidylglycerol synthase transmembrane domain-containing protein [Kiritimatiellia bacterium]
MSSFSPIIKKRVILAMKCLVSILFVVILLATIDVQSLKKHLLQIDPLIAGAGVLLSFAMVAASTWKWSTLLRLQGCPLPFRQLYRWYFVGYFYSNFLPSNVGGDVARAWLASRHARSSATVMISIFVERFTGLILLLVLAVLMPWLRPELLEHPAVSVGMVMGAGGLGLVGLLMVFGVRASRLQWVRGGLLRFKFWVKADRPGKTATLWERLAGKLTLLSGRLGELWTILRTRPGAMLKVSALTLLYYLLMVGNVLLAYRAFGGWADPVGVAAVLPVALMVAMIPVTLGNLGIAESAYVFYFGLVGLDGGLTLAMGLFLRMKILLLGLVGLGVQLKEPVRPESTDHS